MKKITKLFAVILLIFFQSFITPAKGQTPHLTVTDISWPSPSPIDLTVGGVSEYCLMCTNNGQVHSKIDTVVFRAIKNHNIYYFNHDSHGYALYYLTAPSSNLLRNFFTIYNYPGPSADTNLFDTTGANNYIDTLKLHRALGHGYLGVGDTIWVHIAFYAHKCDSNTGANDFYRDSTSHHVDHLKDANNEANVVNIIQGAPQLSGTINVFDSASFCSKTHKDTAEVGFKVKNTDNTAGSPYADSLKIYMSTESALAKLDSFRINGHYIPFVPYVYHYINSGFNIYEINLTKYPAGLHGDSLGANGPRDYSGHRHCNELAADSSFEVTATITYDTVGCPSSLSGCSETGAALPILAALWSKQCDTLPFRKDSLTEPTLVNNLLAQYEYANTPLNSTLTMPLDVRSVSPEFLATACMGYVQSWAPPKFHFDCPHPDYRVVLQMPDKCYHLDTTSASVPVTTVRVIANASHSDLFRYVDSIAVEPPAGCTGPTVYVKPTIEEFYTDSTIIIDFGKLPLARRGGVDTDTYEPQCFKIPLKLLCCFIGATVNQATDLFNAQVVYFCDTTCSNCGQTLTCTQGSTTHHCPGPCTGSASTDPNWILERTNFGDSNTKLPYFWDDCGGTFGRSLTPANIVNDSLPLDTNEAYPGDQVAVLVNGSFNDIPKNFMDVYLQVVHKHIAGAAFPYYLFELDSSKQSYFVLTGITNLHDTTINNKHLNIPRCPLANRSCDNFYTSPDTVGLNFSIYKAMQITNSAWYDSIVKDGTNENITIGAHIFLRVRNDVNFAAYPDFLPCGLHVVDLRADFIAEKDSTHLSKSCDTYAESITLLQSCPLIGLQNSSGGGDITTCNPYQFTFEFETPVSTNLSDDCPYEFHPFSTLDDSLFITLPPNYSYISTQLYTYMDNYDSVHHANNKFLPGATGTYFAMDTVATQHHGGKTVLVYKGLGKNGTYCWPLIDQKQPNNPQSQGYYITVYTQPKCTANSTDTITAKCGFVLGAQQSNPNYQVHIKDTTVSYIIHHDNPSLNVTVPPTVTDYSDSISFTFKICNTTNYTATVPWIAFEDQIGDTVNIGGGVLHDTTSNIYYRKTSGGHTYFHSPDSGIVFDINPLAANDCHVFTYSFFVDPNHRPCPAPDSGKLVVRFGNICSGIIDNPITDTGLCQDTSVTFTYHIFPAVLQIFQDGYRPKPVKLCGDTLVDSLFIESANLATVENVMLTVTPPVGSGITVPRIVTIYPCDTSTFRPHPVRPIDTLAADTIIRNPATGAIEGYGWFLTKDLHLNGLPGALANPSNDLSTMCVKAYLVMNCSYNGRKPIYFKVTGLSTCDIKLADSVPVTPQVDSSCCKGLCYGNFDTASHPIFLTNDSSSHAGTNFNHLNMVINGKFTVNKTTIIEDCDVEMGPLAKIIINPKDSLIIITNDLKKCTHFHAGCNYMWSYIKVNPWATLISLRQGFEGAVTLIEDADSAVYVLNTPAHQGVYQIDSTTFNKNYKSIVISRMNFGIYKGTAKDNIFTCRDLSHQHCVYSLKDTINAPRTTLLAPHAGHRTFMHMDISNVNEINIKRYGIYDNSRYGIYSRASDIRVLQDTFQHISDSINNAAIYFAGSHPTGNTLTVGGKAINQPCIFNDCYIGINADTLIVWDSVINNKFNPQSPKLNFIGIKEQYANSRANKTLIQGNRILNYRVGVFCNQNGICKDSIQENYISAPVCGNVIRGIAVNEVTQPSTALYTIQYDSIFASYGIQTNEVNKAFVQFNNVVLLPNTGVGCPPIAPEIGIGLTHSINSLVKANNISTTPPNRGSEGIYVPFTRTSTISCNNITALDTAMVYAATAPQVNVLYNNMFVGTNTNAVGMVLENSAIIGNQTPGHSASDNTWNGIFSCSSKEFLTLAQANASVFFVRCFTCNFDPNKNPCFRLVTTGAASSIVNNPCGIVGPPPPAAALRPTLQAIAQSTIDFPQYRDTTKRLAKMGVVHAIWENDTLYQDSILHSFQDSIMNTSLGKMMVIDTLMNDTSVANLANTLNSLNAINPESNVERNLKTVAQINLQSILDSGLTPSQITTLQGIANYCSFKDGVAVYQARALLMQFDPTVVYDDYCGNNNDERLLKQKSGDNSESTQINIYPNPNAGSFTIDYQLLEGQTGKVYVYNSVGQELGSYTLNNNVGKMNVNNSELSNGIYYYKLITSDNTTKVGKIVIIR